MSCSPKSRAASLRVWARATPPPDSVATNSRCSCRASRTSSKHARCADKILIALGDPIDVDGEPVITHASIGIASHVGAADGAELMKHADVAMYTAKRNGKGRFDEFPADNEPDRRSAAPGSRSGSSVRSRMASSWCTTSR